MKLFGWSLVLWGAVLPVASAGDACLRPISPEFEKLGRMDDLSAVRARANKLCSEVATSAEVIESSSGGVRSIACIGPQGPEGPTHRWHPNGKLASRGQMTSQSGSPELCGKWQRYDEKGKLRDEGVWADGRPVGTWQTREADGGELASAEFDPAFERRWEWSVVAGLSYLDPKEDRYNYAGVTPININVPGPVLAGRVGYRLFSWLFLETSLGGEAVITHRRDYFGVHNNLSFNPFVTGHVYWTSYNGRWRAGAQVGVQVAFSLDGYSRSSFVEGYGMFVGQFQLPGVPGQRRWFFELGLNPILTIKEKQFFARALVGLRW